MSQLTQYYYTSITSNAVPLSVAVKKTPENSLTNEVH